MHGVQRRLVACVAVNGRHEAALDTDGVVKNFNNRGQAVGGAGRVGHDDIV